MKKLLLSLGIVATICSQVIAQPVITNGSFESWSAPSGLLSLEAPTNWGGSDKIVSDMAMILMLAGYEVSPKKQVYKEDSALEPTDGDIYTGLCTKDLGEELGYFPGVIANGDIEVNAPALLAWMESGEGDFSSIFNITNASPMFGKRVDSLKIDAFTFSLEELGSITGNITVNAMKVVGDEKVLIGSGTVQFQNFTSEPSFVEHTVEMNYLDDSDVAVDTLIIIISSSGPGASDTIYTAVDNIRLFTSDAPSSINSIPVQHLSVDIYPIPAQDFISFNNTLNNKNLVLNVYAFNGQVMEQRSLTNGENKIQISEYASGMYVYEIIDTDKRVKQTGKFIK